MSVHIAVAIPCYNAQDWIGRAISSVLEQSHTPVSLIVVDDGSSDGSVDEVHKFGDVLTLQTGPNQGACAARNMGLRLAREKGADYILFLDADDYLEGDMLAAAARIAAETDADMVMSNMHLEYPDGTRDERFFYSGQVGAEEFFEGWMETRYVNPSALLWHVRLVERVGGWDESLARAQDLDITLRAMLENPTIWKNEEGAAIHARVNTGSISQNVSWRATESRLRTQENLLERIKGTSFEPYAPLLCREIYSISRTAFRNGQTDLGRRGLAVLKAQHYTAHPGTLAHRAVASLIGLENKVWLWGR